MKLILWNKKCGWQKKCSVRKVLLVIFAVFAFGLGPAVYGQTVSRPKGLKLFAERVADRVSAKDIVAVAGFQAATSRFSDRVIDDLINEIVAVKVRIVDRQYQAEVRAEQEYQYSGYVDEASAVSVGHELGATVIILGNGENMADHYRFNFRMISVETREILALFSVDVYYDQEMRRLLDERTAHSGIGSTNFMVGTRFGPGFEMNTADEDMVGSGYSPKEKSNVAFDIALYAAFRFNDVWSVQAEVNFMLNNGMEISGQGSVITIDYPTIDIPLLVRWHFIQTPVVAGIVAGPYISFPAGKLNLSIDDNGAALDTAGNTLGITGGFVLGYKLGPGNLAADVRYLNDFGSLFVREDFGEGMQDAKIGIRRSINVTFGYEFSL